MSKDYFSTSEYYLFFNSKLADEIFWLNFGTTISYFGIYWCHYTIREAVEHLGETNIITTILTSRIQIQSMWAWLHTHKQ